MPLNSISIIDNELPHPIIKRSKLNQLNIKSPMKKKSLKLFPCSIDSKQEFHKLNASNYLVIGWNVIHNIFHEKFFTN